MLLTHASQSDPFEANGMPPTYDSMHKVHGRGFPRHIFFRKPAKHLLALLWDLGRIAVGDKFQNKPEFQKNNKRPVRSGSSSNREAVHESVTVSPCGHFFASDQTPLQSAEIRFGWFSSWRCIFCSK